MPELETQLAELEQTLESGGVSQLLDQVAVQLRQQRRYHELFEALKMQLRHRLNLPLMYHDVGDELDERLRSQLEDGLIEACREVGLLLLSEGKIREGWMYLRPVGNKAEAAEQLAQIEPDEDRLEELIEVALHEGVAPARGYALVLENYGTCNAITTYESAMVRHSKKDQQAAVGLLVEHVHQELRESVKADISRQEGQSPAQETLSELASERDWLFGEHAYHIDTTHLASTVRFSRILEDEGQLRLALDLTAYGRRLNPQFQYQGEEPFADIYPSHALYLGALLDENVEEAVEYFRRRAESLDPDEHGSLPVESYVQLLERLGRYEEAISSIINFAAGASLPVSQVLPLLLDLSQKAGDHSQFLEFCRHREDLLGYATALAQAHLR